MPNSKFKNVLYIIADDWSPLARCYGNEVIKTPHIDAAAAQGVVFDNAFCTSPSCAASRANILTGQYAHTHGQYGHCHSIHGFRTHANMPSTPKYLKDQGFVTGLIGKSHVLPASVYPFDVMPKVAGRNPASFAVRLAEFLNDIQDKPFYLHVGCFDPHRAAYGFGNQQVSESNSEVSYKPDEVIVPDFLPDNQATRTDIAEYYQAVSRYDTTVGTLLRELEQSGRAEDTLVFITSDHGMPFPGAKASSFEGGHHCPLIICHPHMRSKGIHNQAMVNWTNICPTILDWCGVELPANLPERSFLPILEEENPEGWDEVFYSHCFHEIINYYPYRALRGRRYKYVKNYAHQSQVPIPTDIFRSTTWQAVLKDKIEMLGKRPAHKFLKHDKEELFDLKKDSTETHNLINEPGLQEIASEMRKKVIDFSIKTKDPWLELDYQEGHDDLRDEMLTR